MNDTRWVQAESRTPGLPCKCKCHRDAPAHRHPGILAPGYHPTVYTADAQMPHVRRCLRQRRLTRGRAPVCDQRTDLESPCPTAHTFPAASPRRTLTGSALLRAVSFRRYWREKELQLG